MLKNNLALIELCYPLLNFLVDKPLHN